MDNNQIQYIDFRKLVFDPDNPRLPFSLRAKKNDPDYEESVIKWMLQFENVTELIGSIGEKGYFAAEPILAVPNKSGNYEVIEGNRRLTAIKLLNNPALATAKKASVQEIVSEAETIPTEIPCIIFLTRSEVLSYLGYKHITGVQPWDSLAKAKYLKQLQQTLPTNDDFYTQCRKLAKMIGSKANYVKLLLVGVEIFEKIEENDFYNIPTLDEENFEFGVFYTALSRENISQYINVNLDDDNPTLNVNNEHLEDLTKWLFEKNNENASRIGESRNLKYLNKILDASYPMALAAFKDNKTLDEAVRLTNQPLEVFQTSIDDAFNNLKIARDYLHLVNDPTKLTVETLLQIVQLSRILHNAVQSIIIENDNSLKE